MKVEVEITREQVIEAIDWLECRDISPFPPAVFAFEAQLQAALAKFDLEEEASPWPVEGYSAVVTRYGGHQHLARPRVPSSGRHHTLCHGTSAWTVAEWTRNPDHPLLTAAEVAALPPCERCKEAATRSS